jgi:NAD(P)H-hydrate epimerase
MYSAAASVDFRMAPGAKRTSTPVNLRAVLRRETRRADHALAGPRVILSRRSSRMLDALCTAEFNIPSLLLMEHASLGIAEVIERTLRRIPAGILILAGPGNNGGDGLAAARHLTSAGISPITILLIADRARLSADSAANLAMARRLGIRILSGLARPAAAIRREAARLPRPLLIVDALLGTGLSRPADGPILQAIRACNLLRDQHPCAATLAIDVPSGLDADRGLPPPRGEAVRADATLTMAGMKPGLRTAGARAWAGPVAIIPIGAPPRLLSRLGKADTQPGKLHPSAPDPPSPRRRPTRRRGG